ncbi:MAG TPA: exodeoxyribonuclease VII small subunit, partial [Opitutae bacterium]|nr:exodeoxyribonuclease VII small subunit [Opitutae bacterium]
EGQSLEDALARLEAVVESMESGDIPLDKLVARYEEGMQLLKSCEEKL